MNRSRALSFLLVGAATLALPLHLTAAESPTTINGKPIPPSMNLSGKVLEVLDGGGYSYILLKQGSGEKVWAAVPQMKVGVGQEVTLMPGYEMKNFSSKTLNRKFDKVYFSGGLSSQKEVGLTPEAIKKAHQGMKIDAALERAGATAKAAPAKAKEPKAPKAVKIAKAKGPNAYTIAQLWGNRVKLEKKNVTVRGKVVKVSSHIMKRNWIHIEDGTGSEANKTNTLVVTSTTCPKEGDVVTVKGVLRNRIDFGAGYRYELIMIDAKVSGSKKI